MRVEVIRSARRRKTVQARLVDGVLRVSVPATMSRADERRWVEEMTRRIERRSVSKSIDLEQRADQLASRYGLPRPRSIRWAARQAWRWGSCTPADGTVRITSRLAGEPEWVLDYVIVHELAHLRVAAHNKEFWALVRRYPQAERARGFLIARSTPLPDGSQEPSSDGPVWPDDRAEVDDEAGDVAAASVHEPDLLTSDGELGRTGDLDGQH